MREKTQKGHKQHKPEVQYEGMLTVSVQHQIHALTPCLSVTSVIQNMLNTHISPFHLLLSNQSAAQDSRLV